MTQTDTIAEAATAANQPADTASAALSDTLAAPTDTLAAPSDTLKTTLAAEAPGEAGEPLPYSLRTDDTITSLLIACFIVAVVGISNSRGFIARQAKSLFHAPKHDNDVRETTGELRFQLFLALVACLLMAILQHFFTMELAGDSPAAGGSQYFSIAVFSAMFAAYFAAKGILYTFVNAIFFPGRRNTRWLTSLLFIVALEGVALFPVVMLKVYFNLSMRGVVFYVIMTLCVAKLLVFYKCFTIFFKTLGRFLQFIAYLCALEIIPLAALWGVLTMMGSYLKTNF